MQPVGSVAAFLARRAADPAADPVGEEILQTLDAEARLAAEAQSVPGRERMDWLRERSGDAWSAARLAHIEQRAFVALRRQLQQRGLWRE